MFITQAEGASVTDKQREYICLQIRCALKRSLTSSYTLSTAFCPSVLETTSNMGASERPASLSHCGRAKVCLTTFLDAMPSFLRPPAMDYRRTNLKRVTEKFEGGRRRGRQDVGKWLFWRESRNDLCETRVRALLNSTPHSDLKLCTLAQSRFPHEPATQLSSLATREAEMAAFGCWASLGHVQKCRGVSGALLSDMVRSYRR